MAQKPDDIDDLIKKVEKRMAFIEKVVLFVEELLPKIGRQISRKIYKFHTQTVWVLEGFGGFSFEYSAGQSEMGGNNVYVYQGENAKSGKLLFNLYWQVLLEECKVEKFEESGSWVKELIGVMKRKDEIIKQRQIEENKAKQKREQENEKSKDEEKIRQKAIKLGILK